MTEYKVKYPHAQALEIIDKIGAVFVKEEQHDDFYLKIDNGRIYKLQKNDGDIYLVILSREDGGFIVDLQEYLPKEASEVLLSLFKGNQYVLRKARKVYSWKGSKIELDNVEKYGEFLEFYPVDEEAKLELFEKFNIKETDLITKSYFSL